MEEAELKKLERFVGEKFNRVDYKLVKKYICEYKKFVRDEQVGKTMDLFNDNRNKKTLFKNSVVFEFSIFEAQLKEQSELGIDILHYYHAVKDWDATAKKHRDPEGWLATARNFMRSDKQANKLVMTQKNRDTQSEEELDYLKTGRN